MSMSTTGKFHMKSAYGIKCGNCDKKCTCNPLCCKSWRYEKYGVLPVELRDSKYDYDLYKVSERCCCGSL